MDMASSSEEAKEKRRLDDIPIVIPFKVSKYLKHRSKTERILMLTKPYNEEWNEVSDEKEPVIRLSFDAPNEHAFNIMLNLNHKNIRRMRALLKSDSGLSAFVEPCGSLIFPNPQFFLKFHWQYIIPSPFFQGIVRELIDVIDFLRKNDTYHGNLSFMTTFFKESTLQTQDIMVTDFQQKAMDKKAAQLNDFFAIAQMLRFVIQQADAWNLEHPEEQVAYNDTDALIDLICQSNEDLLPLIKKRALNNVFFWTKSKRIEVMSVAVRNLLRDNRFRRMVDSSDICELPWNDESKNRKLQEDYEMRLQELLIDCNRYRSDLNDGADYAVSTSPGKRNIVEPFNIKERIGLVKFAFAAYSHNGTFEDEIDEIFRLKYPKLFAGLYHIIQAFDSVMESTK